MDLSKGFFNPRFIRAITFYIISFCVILSVMVSRLAIWKFADPDTLWRTIATFAVIGVGSAIFAFVNGIFGTKD